LALTPGEEHKDWEAVETILRSAGSGGLGRDGLIIGVGGGVVCDLTAFAASIYMRGCNLALVPTTLLCMVDAALGGKTGFDLEGFKNLAGTFYPAGTVFAAAEALATLPQKEWKSGMAELIKTTLLDTDPQTFDRLREERTVNSGPGGILPFVELALKIKGNIVAADPRETGTERALLNLGHTFGHALESALGLGALSHGEAVAWGMARSCELGLELGITPPPRAEAILATLNTWGYTTSAEAFLNPDIPNKTSEKFREALILDKKKKAGKLRFVVPAAERAVLVEWNNQIEQYVESLTNAF
jgi:3-dehydroquinate synthase